MQDELEFGGVKKYNDDNSNHDNGSGSGSDSGGGGSAFFSIIATWGSKDKS